MLMSPFLNSIKVPRFVGSSSFDIYPKQKLMNFCNFSSPMKLAILSRPISTPFLKATSPFSGNTKSNSNRQSFPICSETLTKSDPLTNPMEILGPFNKEVCNGGVACSLLKLGSLEKTVIASLFHSGLHSGSPFFVKKTTLHNLLPS